MGKSCVKVLLVFILVVLSYFYIDIPLAWRIHAWNVPRPLFEVINHWTAPIIFWLLLPVLYTCARLKRRHDLARIFLLILVAVACAGLLTELLKAVIGRERPYELFHHAAYGFVPFHSLWDGASFPSGHATFFGSLWVVLSILFPKRKWQLLPLFILLSLTRLFGWHYFSDIVAGFALGCFVARFVLKKKNRELLAR